MEHRANSRANGDRDRLGRTSRRLADWFRAPRISPRNLMSSRPGVFGGTPKTAGETPALPGKPEVHA
jgi:hypothetical protein